MLSQPRSNLIEQKVINFCYLETIILRISANLKTHHNAETSPPNIEIPNKTPTPKLPNLLARFEVVVAVFAVVELGVDVEDGELVEVEFELVK